MLNFMKKKDVVGFLIKRINKVKLTNFIINLLRNTDLINKKNLQNLII